jgi:hypothetical protein
MRQFILFSVLFLAFASSSQGSVFLDPGVYSGRIHPAAGGPDVPIDFLFSYSNEEEGSDPGELIPIKKKIDGSFVVDHEGGPYSLVKVDHDIDTGAIDMKYSRPDSPVGPPALRFQGTLSHNQIKGTVKSGLPESSGPFGTFEIIKTDEKIVTQDFMYTGIYKGVFHHDHPADTVPMVIKLGAGTIQTPNPIKGFELGFTPGHNDSFTLNTWEQNASYTNIDYLRRIIKITYVGSAGTLTLTGQVTFDGIIGDGVASYKSRIGTFEVRKMKSE